MKYTKENSLLFIEQWYGDIEKGYVALGKVYTRPADYIERALRIMNASTTRNRLLSQYEGKRGYYREDN